MSIKKKSNYNHFDQIDCYDDEIPKHVAKYLLEVRTQKTKKVLEKNKVYLKKENTLHGIDLGCGTGEHMHYLQKDNSVSEIDGLDFSKKQLAHAKKKGFKNHFIHSSMSNMKDIDDGIYDFAYAINSIHHLPSKQEQLNTFNEVFRILKPNGIFIVHEINVINPLIRFYVNYIFPRIRNIDDGSEIWLTETLVKKSNFIVDNIEYFTFVPDFTPRFFMSMMIKIDKILSNSSIAKFGAHTMFVLKKPRVDL